MRAKREKTEFGSVKAVVPIRKKAVYGTVVPPSRVDSSMESTKPPEPTAFGTPTDEEGENEGQAMSMSPEFSDEGEEVPVEESPEGTPMKPEPSESGEEKESTKEEEQMKPEEKASEEDPMEKLRKLVESMEDYAEQKKKEEEAKEKEEKEKSEEEKKEEESKSEEEKQKEQQQKHKEEQENKLTKYLTLQLKIRALSEIFGAVKIAEKGKQYFSYCAFEGGQGYSVYRSAPAPQNVIVALDVYPFFETQDEAEAFLELCEVLMKDYGQLAINLNAQAIASVPVKVTYPDSTKF